MKSKALVLFLCLALIASAFIGCTNKETTEEVADSQEETAVETQVEEAGVIKIGVAAPITGNYAEYGIGFDVATTIAAEEINANGGINGKQIELVTMDSKGDAKEATAIARQFSENEEIMAVVGDFSSTCCMAAAPIYDEAGLSQVSPTASNPDYPDMSKYMFTVMGAQTAEAPFMAKQVLGQYLEGIESIGVIYLNNDWGVAAKQYLIETAKATGIDVVAEESHVDGEKDFTAVLAKVQQSNPDAIVLVTFYNETAIIANQTAQMGWDVQLTAVGPGASQQIIDLGGQNVEGLIADTMFFVTEDSSEEAISFRDKFEEKAGFTLNMHSACAYDALKMVAAAMENCETITRDAVQEELIAMADFEGVTGPIQFQENGSVLRKYLIVEVENGEWVAKTDYDYYEAE
jgi:branched-chain amino acid transport system substrate-binding protein